jgi:hypothetical protein
VLADGPFRVRVRATGFNLVYSEGQNKLTLPLEFGLDGSCNVGAALIRHWDGSSQMFQKAQKFTIERNIFAALD